ncbi:MAG: hypothetical protein ACREDK_07220 [Thermoplasmata archaeon]
MSLPGASAPVLTLGLLAFALGLVLIGEAVRTLVGSKVPLLRNVDPVERIVLGAYLGIGVLYALAAVPPGGFYPLTFPVAVTVASATLLLVHRSRLRSWVGSRPTHPAGPWFPRAWIAPLVVVATGVGLFLVEIGIAQGQPTGNTFDSSLYTTYVALLNAHHLLPASFSPIAPYAIAYPQGATVVFASAQSMLGLAPPRTALLVTPLFFGLAPLGAYVFGRRTFASAPMGIAFALVTALLAEWTRTLVAGSNDFVLAFPLVLMLWGWIPEVWGRAHPPDLRAALAFGAIAGVSAALNPVGAEAIVLAVLLLVIVRAAERATPLLATLPRWGASVGATLVGVLPSLIVLAQGAGLEGSSTLSGSTIPYGLTLAGWVGRVDPFLFRPGNDNLSSFPILRTELAVLLVIGVLVLVVARRPVSLPSDRTGFGMTSGMLGVALTVLLTVETLPSLGLSALASASRLTSADELSWLLFALYTMIAAVPLGLLLHRFLEPRSAPSSVAAGRPTPPPPLRRSRPPIPLTGPVALGLAVLLLVPGAVVTVTELPSGLAPVYRNLGDTSSGDFALLAWSADGLPNGARVLVAPGSSAEFLPGYQPTVVLLYPMVVFGAAANASYALVVSELTNATLDVPGREALAALQVGYIVVTGVNTDLWTAFSPAPLLASPHATLLFHDADAYAFAWAT